MEVTPLPLDQRYRHIGYYNNAVVTPLRKAASYKGRKTRYMGMRLKVFSKVYCDRVYIWCAELFMTGSVFETPAAPPTHLIIECLAWGLTRGAEAALRKSVTTTLSA